MFKIERFPPFGISYTYPTSKGLVEETLKSDFEQAAKVLKTKYKYSVRIQNQAFSEIRETETRISLKIKENITVTGYRVSRAKSLIDGVFFEISMELENKQLVVKSIDYRNVK